MMRKHGTRRCGSVLKPLKAYFGYKMIGEITRADVREFCTAKMAEGLSPGTVRIKVGVLSTILNVALEDELIDKNPAAKPGKFLPKTMNSRPFLTPEAAQSLLHAIRETDPDLYAYALIMLRAGLRIGEARALEWGDVDLAKRTLTVSKTDYMGVVGTPKGGRPRTIPLSGDLADTLKAHRTRTAAASLKSGRKLVFPDEMGRPLRGGVVNNRLAKCLVAAGLPKMTSHALRHSFGTHLFLAGAPAPFVRDALGHRELGTTNLYAHAVTPGAEVFNAVDLMGKRAGHETPRNQDNPVTGNTK
jgi:integrase